MNYLTLEPGEVVTPHAHERQEGLFVPLTGGQIETESAVYEIPQGGVARVGSEPIRNVCNQSENEAHILVIIGAPPVGSVEGFGEYVWPENEDCDDGR